MNTTIASWLNGRDTGASSIAIVAFMEGASGPFRYPLDPDDLGRCIRLLAIAPEYRERWSEMAQASEEWAALVGAWDELVTLYAIEAPNRRAPKCYERMRELLRPIEDRKRKAYWEARGLK